MKVPTKAELKAEIAAKDTMIQMLIEERDKEKLERWEKNIPYAKKEFFRQINSLFSCVCNVRFEHVDEAGYWFTFKLTNDGRRQTYCVYHKELEV